MSKDSLRKKRIMKEIVEKSVIISNGDVFVYTDQKKDRTGMITVDILFWKKIKNEILTFLL